MAGLVRHVGVTVTLRRTEERKCFISCVYAYIVVFLMGRLVDGRNKRNTVTTRQLGAQIEMISGILCLRHTHRDFSSNGNPTGHLFSVDFFSFSSDDESRRGNNRDHNLNDLEDPHLSVSGASTPTPDLAVDNNTTRIVQCRQASGVDLDLR